MGCAIMSENEGLLGAGGGNVEQRRMSRRQMVVTGLSATIGVVLTSGVAGAATGASGQMESPASRNPNGVMHIVAHADDTFLFLSPDAIVDVAKAATRIVFVTAGENVFGAAYWESREAGALAGLAKMAGLSNTWTIGTQALQGVSLVVATHATRPALQACFLRLPDGNYDGSGFPATNNQSLQGLWTGAIPSITTVDGAATYTQASLISLLTALMQYVNPKVVRTQDYVNPYSDGDHSDHHSVAYFVQAAFEAADLPKSSLVGYLGYPTKALPANISGKKLLAKATVFLTYAPYDGLVPQTATTLASSNYGSWVARQYTVATPE